MFEARSLRCPIGNQPIAFDRDISCDRSGPPLTCYRATTSETSEPHRASAKTRVWVSFRSG